MTGNTIRSYLNLTDNFPFPVRVIKSLDGVDIVEDFQQNRYLILKLTKEMFLTYTDLTRYSLSLAKSVYEIKDQNNIYLMFDGFDEMTEERVKWLRLFPLLNQIFEKSSFEITLKKEHLRHLENLYRLLDHKFSYIEMRIRELETSPVKNDIHWVILSKYHILLDAKIYLYDLQQDLFHFIDQKQIVRYGLIYRKINEFLYHKGKILPCFDLYYGPLGMLCSRYYLSLPSTISSDFLKKEIDAMDEFNKKYFCFMTLYILVLNVHLEIQMQYYQTMGYLKMCTQIQRFMKEFREYIAK